MATKSVIGLAVSFFCAVKLGFAVPARAATEFTASTKLNRIEADLEKNDQAAVEPLGVLARETRDQRADKDPATSGNQARARIDALWKSSLDLIVAGLKERPEYFKTLEARIRELDVPKPLQGDAYWDAYYKNKTSIYANVKREAETFETLIASLPFAGARAFSGESLLTRHLRAANFQGKPENALELFGLCTAVVQMQIHSLTINHARAIADGDASLTLAGFTILREDFATATTECRKHFPALPDFLELKNSVPFVHRRELIDRIAARKGIPRERVDLLAILDAVDAAKIDPRALEQLPIVRFFGDSRGSVDGTTRNRVVSLLQVHARAADYQYQYLTRFFPQKRNDEYLQTLAANVQKVPGAQDCVTLALGYSHFDGPPCQIQPFNQAMANFIDGYESLAGTSTIPSILAIFLEFKDQIELAFDNLNEELPAAKWTELRDRLDAWMENGKFAPKLQAAWKATIAGAIFADTRRLHNLIFNTSLGEPKKTDKTPDMLRAHVRAAFLRAGYGASRNQDVLNVVFDRMGFEKNYTAVIQSAKTIHAAFQEKVVDLVGEDTVFRRYTLEDACIKKERPPVINAVGFETNGKPEVARFQGPWGFQRFGYPQKADAYKDAAKLNNPLANEKYIAGLGMRTAITMILQAAVQSRMLRTGFMGDSLKSIGIRETKSEHLALVDENRPFLGWKDLISLSKRSFYDMVEGHAHAMGEEVAGNARKELREKNPKATIDEENVAGENARREFMDRFRAAFLHYRNHGYDRVKTEAYVEVREAYRKKFRRNVAQRAEQLRMLHDQREKLLEKAIDKAPSIAYAMNIPPEFLGHVPVPGDPEKFKTEYLEQRRMNASLLRDLRGYLYRDYLVLIDGKWAPTKQDSGEWKSGIPTDRRTYDADINQAEKDMTVDGFARLLALHVGGDEFGQWFRARIGFRMQDQIPWTREILGEALVPRGLGTVAHYRYLSGRRLENGGGGAPYMAVSTAQDFARFIHRTFGVISHVRDHYGRRKEYVDLAIRYALYDAPMLAHKEWFRKYDDAKFDALMKDDEDMRIGEINSLFSYTNGGSLFKRLMPNIVLWNAVLRMYPDIAQGLCATIDSHKRWDLIVQGAEFGVIAACAVLAMIPPLTPVATVAAVGVGALTFLGSSYDTFVVKAGQLGHVEALTYGGSPSLGMDDMELGAYLQTELRSQYTTAVVIHAIEVALIAVPLVKRLPKLREGIKELWNGYWAAREAMKAEIAARVAINEAARRAAIPKLMGNPLVRALVWFKDALLAPLRWIGLIERQSTNSLFRMLFDQRGGVRTFGAASRGWRQWEIDSLLEMPWCLFSHQWGSGFVGKAGAATLMYLAGLGILHHADAAAELPLVLMMDQVQKNPARFRALQERVMQGKLSQKEMMTMVELDKDASEAYSAEFEKVLIAFDRAQNDDERKEYFAALETTHRAYKKKLGEMVRRKGFDPNEYFDVMMTNRHMTKMLEFRKAAAR